MSPHSLFGNPCALAVCPVRLVAHLPGRKMTPHSPFENPRTLAACPARLAAHLSG